MTEDKFSKQLQKLRRARGLTQEQLARQLGVSPQAVSKWENGGYPEGDLIPVLADLFGVSVSYLYGREEEKPSLEQQVLDKIREETRPGADGDPNCHPEVAEHMLRLIWAMLIAPWANNREYYPPVRPEPGVNTAALLADNASFSFMNLNSENRFFVLSREPEEPVPEDPAAAELLRLLGEKDMLALLRFMLTLAPKEYVSAAVAARAAGVTQERTEELFRRLDARSKWNSLLQRVSTVNARGERETLYGIETNTAGLLVALFQIEKVLLDPPDGYQMQIGMRSKGYAPRKENGHENG